jgi:hypothetical protein
MEKLQISDAGLGASTSMASLIEKLNLSNEALGSSTIAAAMETAAF